MARTTNVFLSHGRVQPTVSYPVEVFAGCDVSSSRQVGALMMPDSILRTRLPHSPSPPAVDHDEQCLSCR